MTNFLTLDINGWLDHLFDNDEETGPDEKARALGFRSSLFRHEGTWLFGAQALSAARHKGPDAQLIDAIEALASAAGHGESEESERRALPTALWQLVSDESRRADAPVNLALVVPDGRYLGTPKIGKTGKTPLEVLHHQLKEARPTTLTQSRIELVWRSVAALHAVMNQGSVGDKPGKVLVISVNRRIFWTVLELRHWSPSDNVTSSLRIVRSPVMDDCTDHEGLTAQRVSTVLTELASKGIDDLAAVRKWTRSVEIAATGMSRDSLAKIGIDASAIEHRTWPTSDGAWKMGPDAPSIEWAKTSLPSKLAKRIERFCNQEEDPLAIIVESPVGIEMTEAFESLVRKIAAGVRIFRAKGANVAKAASELANALGRDPNVPAWLDEVASIELEVHNRGSDDSQESITQWMEVIPRKQAIPAGELYHSHPDASRQVKLAPGVEHVHLHLRRGNEGAWDERYSGKNTGHTIRPSDHVRIVEPRARVRPLSEEVRIEIVEHLPDGKEEALAASRSSIKWSDMAKAPPFALRSIPELYIFKTSIEAWRDLKPLLQQVVEADVGEISNQLKNKLYKCTQKQWRERKFPLGSDGQPPRMDPQQHRASRILLRDSSDKLLLDLEAKISRNEQLGSIVANRLHMPLTWLFTGCPERTVEILLEALMHPNDNAGRTLHVDNEFSAWSIYSGIGRAVRSEDALREIYDTLVEEWENRGGQKQDKFLLAAVTHPMARRVAVRKVLNESRKRFQRVKRFLDKQLENLVKGIHDPRLGKKQKRLELRYVAMGYRGLCQVRYANPDWFSVDDASTKDICEKLLEASGVGGDFEKDLVGKSAPYLIGKGEDPSMPSGF